MEEESIYNLIPKEYVPPPRESRYKSHYPAKLPPTGSTLINHTTSRPGVANLNGDFEINKGPHTHKNQQATMGKPKGSVKPDTQQFRLRGTGSMGSNKLPDMDSLTKFTYTCPGGQKRDPVPKKDEKPILGLKSNKNFIITNAVENILSAPKVIKSETDWTKKRDFGQTPQYLQKIKDNIDTEYKMIQNLHLSEAEEMERQKYVMSPEEVKQLRNGLKAKWEAVNKEYQSITHIKYIDTVGLKRKKEDCEKELAQLEKDIEKLNKAYIFVDTTR